MFDVGFHPSYISTNDWSTRYERIDPNLAELLDRMTADSNRASALYKRYEAPYATIHIYAITEQSGTLTIPVGGDKTPEQFNHKGIGTTIIAWGKDKPVGNQTWEYQIYTACNEAFCNVLCLHDANPEGQVINDTPIVHL